MKSTAAQKTAEEKNDQIAEEDDEQVAERTSSFDTSKLSPPERKVYDVMIPHKPMSLDDLSSCGLSTNVIQGALTLLEIAGAIEVSPGGFFTRK